MALHRHPDGRRQGKEDARDDSTAADDRRRGGPSDGGLFLAFDLNCIIGTSSCSSSASYGTLTLTANTSGLTSVLCAGDRYDPRRAGPAPSSVLGFNLGDGLRHALGQRVR
jgi:hypothetical protein